MKQKKLKVTTSEKLSKDTKDRIIKKMIKELEENWDKDNKNYIDIN